MLMAAARWSDANINPSDKNNCIAAVPNELATLASCDSCQPLVPPGGGGYNYFSADRVGHVETTPN
jgi:hypothetical protein